MDVTARRGDIRADPASRVPIDGGSVPA